MLKRDGSPVGNKKGFKNWITKPDTFRGERTVDDIFSTDSRGTGRAVGGTTR